MKGKESRNNGKAREIEFGAGDAGEAALLGAGEGAGGPLDLIGEAQALGDLQEDGDRVGAPAELGAPIPGGDDGGFGAEETISGGHGADAGHEAPEPSGPEHGAADREALKTGEEAVEDSRSEAAKGVNLANDEEDGRESTATRGDDLEGAEQPDDSQRRREGTGVEEHLLRMGAEGSQEPDRGFDGLCTRPTFRPARLGEGSVEAEAR